MTDEKIRVSDIRGIGSYGTLVVELPNYLTCMSAKNTVQYVKKAYPREDGLDYWCKIDGNTITIGTK